MKIGHQWTYGTYTNTSFFEFKVGGKQSIDHVFCRLTVLIAKDNEIHSISQSHFNPNI